MLLWIGSIKTKMKEPAMTSKTVEVVTQKLKDAFMPHAFELIDNSWQHAGHAGNTMGGSHLDIRMVSDAFEGVSTLKRHRMVHAVLKKEMQGPVHALELSLKSPLEG
jgi:BolA protein